jgi:hypothetical protein
LGLGAEYATKDKKNYFIYPLSLQNHNGTGPEISQSRCFGVKKALYDLDENLIAEGKNQSGTWFSVNWFYKQKIFKNITLENRLSLIF